MHRAEKIESEQQKSSQEEQKTTGLKVHPCFHPEVPEFVVICPVCVPFVLLFVFLFGPVREGPACLSCELS